MEEKSHKDQEVVIGVMIEFLEVICLKVITKEVETQSVEVVVGVVLFVVVYVLSVFLHGCIVQINTKNVKIEKDMQSLKLPKSKYKEN